VAWLKPLARLCLPYSIVQWRRKRTQELASQKYGPLL
jgi:hypothetical protein